MDDAAAGLMGCQDKHFGDLDMFRSRHGKSDSYIVSIIYFSFFSFSYINEKNEKYLFLYKWHVIASFNMIINYLSISTGNDGRESEIE